jgi:hypothetical protein
MQLWLVTGTATKISPTVILFAVSSLEADSRGVYEIHVSGDVFAHHQEHLTIYSIW